MSTGYGSTKAPNYDLDGMVIEPADDDQSSAQVSRNAPFSCNVCKRSYTRVDHLARHYRSHTKERPFRCGQCGNRFSRADLLRRHVAAHDNKSKDKRPNSRISLAINRVSSACITCSAAKVKCSEEKPCTRCVTSKIVCEMPQTSHDRPQYIPTSSTASIDNDETYSPSSAAIAKSLTTHITGDDHVTSADFLPDADQGDLAGLEDLPGANDPVEHHIELGMDAGPSSMQPRPSAQQDTAGNDQTGLDFNTTLGGGDTWPQLDSSLADFLSQIMIPLPSPFATVRSTSEGAAEEHNLFEFGIEDGGGFADFDFGSTFDATVAPIVPTHPVQQMLPMDTSEPPSRADDGVVPLSHSHTTEAFMRSVWQWIPGKLDQSGNEHSNLSLPSNVGIPVTHTERPCQERLTQSSRDRILAMIAGTCDSSAFFNIAVQFPTADVLDCLIQDFLFVHRKRAVSFFHVPTFRPNAATPELTAMIAACGAVLNSVPMVRKLGYALQETIRLAGPRTWEKDNSRTRELAMLQAFHMCLQVGIFSGNKRKMEISESQQQPLVTMMRRSGRFSRPRSAAIIPLADDGPEELDAKWRAWAEAESWKRLVFAHFVHDGHVSMSFIVPPIMSNTELALGLPASNVLWSAPTANEWRDAYHRQYAGAAVRIPSVRACITDIHAMLDASRIIDVPFVRHVMLSVFWRQIWESRQLTFLGQASEGSDPSSNLCLATRPWRQDCARSIRYFRMAVSDIEALSEPAALVHEHLLLNIFVSFEELSRFSGKEGTSEAVKALPILRQWAKGRDSRQAVWHAGQLIRKAASFPSGLLRDFYAIALYHAGLTIWAYGLLTNAMTSSGLRRESHGLDSLALAAEQQHLVPLDTTDESNDALQKFISLGRGLPAITRVNLHATTDVSTKGQYVLLRDPMAAMETVINTLKQNHGTVEQRSIPLLVENLINLMSDLSKAAMKMRKS